MVQVVREVVAEVLRRRGSRGWLVGGTVRDMRLGRLSPDVDVVVRDDPREVARGVAAELGAPWFPLSTRHGAYRVMAPQGHIDCAAIQGEGIEDDLGRRDFTVNAMALPVEGGDLVDPFGGARHLSEGSLVGVSARIFRDDPLRLMRAPRFCHVLGLQMHDGLEELLRREVRLVARAAGERVTNELVLTLEAGRTAEAARRWDDLGLLEVLLPEASAAADAGTGGRNERAPLWAALDRLDHLLEQPRTLLPDRWGDVLWARLEQPVDGVFSRPVALRFAAILGEPDPEEVAAVTGRLHLSSALLSLLRAQAQCFSSGACAADALTASARPGRATVSWLWNAAPWEPEILLLAGVRAEPTTGGGQHLVPDPVATLLGSWAERARLGVSTPPVDGETLMSALGLEPGPLLGSLLREVRLAWEAGEETTADGLLGVARRRLAAGGGAPGTRR